jgi:hypothetical protein
MEEVVRHKKRRHETEASNPWDWQTPKHRERGKQTTQEEIDFCVYSCPFPDGCKYGECQALRDFKKTL